MLKPVYPALWLLRMDTHEWLDINIRVKAFHICIGMVADIVFYFPVIGIAAHHIQEIGAGLVKPCMFGKTLVATFVHHIEAYTSQVETQKGA